MECAALIQFGHPMTFPTKQNSGFFCNWINIFFLVHLLRIKGFVEESGAHSTVYTAYRDKKYVTRGGNFSVVVNAKSWVNLPTMQASDWLFTGQLGASLLVDKTFD